MVRRSRKHALAVVLVLATGATAGCKSKKKDAAARLRDIEGIEAVPATTDVVLGADVPALAKSELVERAVARMLLGDPGLSKALNDLFATCGFKPERDLRQVVLAMDAKDREGNSADADRALLVATGNLSEAKVTACVAQHMSSVGGALVQKPVGGRTHYHADAPPDRQDVWFAFGRADTVVVSSSPDFLDEALREDVPRLLSDADLTRLVGRARQPAAAVWAAGRVPPEVGEGLRKASAGAVGAPRAMFGHATLSDGLTVELGVEMANPAEANSAVSMAKTQLSLLAQVAQKWKLGRLVAKVSVESAADTVFVRLALTRAELEAALAPIDTGTAGGQTAAPLEQNEGAMPHGEGDATPGGEAPVPEQGQAD